MIGLAVQVRKPANGPVDAMPGTAQATRHDGQSVRLIRLWAADLVTPVERVVHGANQGSHGFWSEYIDLRRVQEQNKQLQETVDRLRLEQAMLREDALQGQRLQTMLKFQENYIYKTTPAQVIGTSGSNQSYVVWLDKGSDDGLERDDAVITPDGIVGKVRDVFSHTAQVLLINDQTSGAGVILEKTRIRGILRGNAAGLPQVIDILADQRIQPGEKVLTAGGDQIFPRGLPVGSVERMERDPERGAFANVIVKPAADLQRLDEVLVITSLAPKLSDQAQADLATSEALKGAEAAEDAERKKATEELAERLPGLKDPNAPAAPAQKMGPDGKPLPAEPVVPQVPKPLPTKHLDRFSPGAPAYAPADSGQTDDGGAAAGSEVKPKANAPRQTTPQPPKPKPESATTPNGAGRIP